MRKAGLNIMMSLKGDGKPVSFIEDCAVPLEHLADYTDALTEVFARHGTRGTWYAHASVGTLHVRPILDMRRDGAAQDARDRRGGVARWCASTRARSAASTATACAAANGSRGSSGRALNDAFRAIKDVLDPAGLFNPGKIVDPPKMDDARAVPLSAAEAPRRTGRSRSSRCSTGRRGTCRTIPRTEAIRRPARGGDPTGGFAKAVEMCNNNGHCRKFDAGTMCPSYRVTRDEQHVTRGRANTLRLALSGQLGAGRVHRATRCTTRWTSASAARAASAMPDRRRHGADEDRVPRPLHEARTATRCKDRLVARLPDYAHAASRVAWLANLRNRVPGAALARRDAARPVARRRTLPRWRGDTFWRARDRGDFADAEATIAARGGAKAAVLFVDTFNGIFESENALAAARVLQGRRLHRARARRSRRRTTCCGRTFLAAGMVDEARAARRRAARRAAAVRRAPASPIVGLEPSCLLTLRDEALAHGPRRRRRAPCRAQALLFEEFIAREAKAGRFDARLHAGRARRCWCTATATRRRSARSQPILDVLRLIPGAKPELIETLVLRHGRQLRLRGEPPRRSRCDGRAEPAAGGPQRARRASSSPTARAAGSRSPTARRARRCTSRASSSASCPPRSRARPPRAAVPAP